MPYRNFRPIELVYNATDFGLLDTERLELRRVNTLGIYDRAQDLPTNGAIVSMDPWFNRALDINVGWRLVYAEADRPRDADTYEFLGYIDYQIGNASQWWYYNGAAWVLVVNASTDWGTEINTLTYFATYPGKTSRTLRVRLRVRPDSTGDYAPQLTGLCISWPIDASYQPEDDVVRSLKDYCEAVSIPAVERATLTANSTTVTLTSDYTPLPSGSWKVYNLTADPTRLVNLFSSWASLVVTMTGVQTAGSDIEIRFEGTLNAYVSADEMSEDSESPSFVIQSSGENRVNREISQLPNKIRLPEPGLTALRVEHVAETLQMPMRIYAQATKHYIARAMIDALKRRIQLDCGMTSYSWGGKLTFRIIERAGLQYTQANKGLHVFALSVEALTPQWHLSRDSYLEPALQNILVNFGSTSTVYGTVTISR